MRLGRIADQNKTTIGALVGLACTRLISDYGRDPELAYQLQPDKRRREARLENT